MANVRELFAALDDKEKEELTLIANDWRHMMDNPEGALLSQKEIEYALSGKKILAIKTYRERVGCSLRGAKKAVEAYQAGAGVKVK